MKKIAWQRVALPTVAFFQEGPGLRSWQWTDSGMKVINGTNIRDDGRFDPSNTTRAISLEEFRAKYRHFAIDANDIVVASSGTLGKAARVKAEHLPMMMNTSVIRFRSNDWTRLDDGFLFAWLRSRDFLDQALGMATGAAQQNFGPSHVKQMTLPLPAIGEQRRIASILSAYDDLIENNTRRIAILEEMARRIYEEWFVRFRFPGHEGVRMVESESGLVPEGWRAAVLGDVAAYINRGLAPKYDDAAACIVINQKCIRDQRLNLGEARKQSKPVPAEKVIRFGDVLINSTGVGTLGRVAQVLEAIDNCTVDTHVSIVRPGKECDLDFFGLTLLAQQAHFEAQGVGSTGQTELSRGRIAETSVVVPPLAMQRAFGKLVQPMRRLTVTLQNKNMNLGTTRDLLLPKLISGELDVSSMPEPEALAA